MLGIVGGSDSGGPCPMRGGAMRPCNLLLYYRWSACCWALCGSSWPVQGSAMHEALAHAGLSHACMHVVGLHAGDTVVPERADAHTSMQTNLMKHTCPSKNLSHAANCLRNSPCRPPPLSPPQSPLLSRICTTGST